MSTEVNYDFASNIDMAKAMSNIDCIAKQIAEKNDAAICKAFTISIASLLRENGIIPIMTEHKRMLETDRERFIFKSTYGVCFNDLDTSEHDAKVRADAIQEFANELIKPSNYERFDFDDCLDSSEKANDFFKYVFDTVERLKGGAENE